MKLCQFLLACWGLAACSTPSAQLTAAGTITPVLLSRVDRIGGGSSPAVRRAEADAPARFGAKVKDHRLMLVIANQTSVRKSVDTPAVVDVAIANAACRTGNSNVYVAEAKATAVAWYFLFGMVEKYELSLDAERVDCKVGG